MPCLGPVRCVSSSVGINDRCAFTVMQQGMLLPKIGGHPGTRRRMIIKEWRRRVAAWALFSLQHWSCNVWVDWLGTHTLTCRIMLMLVQVMEEKLDNKNVELARVSAADGKFKIASTAELETVIQRL
jgi:hypothetical protein